MKLPRHRVLIQHNETLYRLLNFGLAFADGSLYLSLVRRGKSQGHWRYQLSPNAEVLPVHESNGIRRRGAEISYHSSGLIRYKESSNRSIFAEPLAAISRPFWFCTYSVPAIARLDPQDGKRRPTDYILEVPDAIDGRVEFKLALAPLLPPSSASDLACHFDFPALGFSLVLLFQSPSLPIPDHLSETFIVASPSIGLFEEPQIDPDDALILFHKRMTGRNDVILYSPNSEGVYRVVYSVQKRVPPEVEVVLAEPGMHAEVIDSKKAYARFRIVDRSGSVVKRPVAFSSIAFSAEL